MKFLDCLYLLLLFLGNLFCQLSSPGSSDSLEAVTVKEKYEVFGTEQKLPVYLKMNFSDLIELPESLQWSALPVTQDKENEFADLINLKLSFPEFANIIPKPAKTFQLAFQDLSSWNLHIFNSAGGEFWRISGKGNPPPIIAWDGLGNTGEPLTPGTKYSYTFTAISKAGNKRIFPGESFFVPALYLYENNRLWIGIAASCLFSEDGYSLLPAADDYCKELMSLFYYYADKGMVSVSCDHSLTEVFLAKLSNFLEKDIHSFQRTNEGSAQPECLTIWID